jgi:hypothetical protein
MIRSSGAMNVHGIRGTVASARPIAELAPVMKTVLATGRPGLARTLLAAAA